MTKLQALYDKFVHRFDEEQRTYLLFSILNLTLSAVSLVMSIINFFTREYILMAVTLGFMLLCVFNVLYLRIHKQKSLFIMIVFTLEILALFGYFIVSGAPQGFSILWITLIPAFAFIAFGIRFGMILCSGAFVLLLFFFWTPIGQGLLMHDYFTDTFMLRFPFVYLSLTVISLYIEAVRFATARRMSEREQNYKFTSQHDQLTGVYNRHAFYQRLAAMLKNPHNRRMSVILMDIDNFKRINDTHGHTAGDDILRNLAEKIQDSTCDHCLSCRWGGEEFLILMNCEHDPYQTCEQIRSAVEGSSVTCGDCVIRYTISLGLCSAQNVTEANIAEMIKYADSAMYESKRNGKNQTSRHDLHF